MAKRNNKEIKEIEKQPIPLRPTAAAIKVKTRGVFSGFFEFLRKYSVIGLAIGIVIGDSSKTLVNSIVSGLITPFLGLFLPNKQSLQNFKLVFRNQTFEIGNVIESTLSFMIILFIIYFVIKIVLRKEDWIEKK